MPGFQIISVWKLLYLCYPQNSFRKPFINRYGYTKMMREQNVQQVRSAVSYSFI